MNAVVLDNSLKETSKIELPKRYAEVKEHNLYLYIKSYLAGLRANSAKAKTRAEVSGGGKKPWAQKGGGRARAGSITSPIFVGGGKAFGPSNNRNYNLKVNKKQKKLALDFALAQKASAGKLFIVDSCAIKSGKTKDAAKLFNALGQRSALFVTKECDDNTYYAFRNLKQCYVMDVYELNAYFIAAFGSVIIEKAAYDLIVREDA